jgi:hypothetical protein
MKQHRLEDMVGGWMVGDFEPSCIKTEACEVACKMYAANAGETSHVHRVATELTLSASGRVTMNGRTYVAGDIIIIEPGEHTDFYAHEPTVTVVVKMPSVRGDKYTYLPREEARS